MENEQKLLDRAKTEFKKRAMTVRVRTLGLTIIIVIALVFYFIMQTTFKESINLIDFFFLCVVAILMHCIYFPDGELYA